MKVGFTGAYCTANFGDYAILINNIFDINADENIIFTYSNSFPHKALKHYCSKRNYSTQEVFLKSEICTSENITPFECISVVENMEEIVELVDNLDVLCVSGGGYLDDNWCSRKEKFIKIVTPIIIAERLNKKIVFMAQGIGPIVCTKEMMRYFFNYLKNPCIAIRDNYCSESYLKELGVKQECIFNLPDDLLFLNKSLIQNMKLNIEEPYIVVVIHDSVDYVKENLNLFSEFVNNMKRLYGVRVAFLPFDLVWYGYEQSEYLSRNIPGSNFVDITEEGFPAIEKVYSLVKNAQMVITGRYHASVIAFQTQTPVMIKLKSVEGCVNYSYNKVYGILQKIFNGTLFSEDAFIAVEWEELLQNIVKKYNDIIDYQKNLYRSKTVSENMNNMKEARNRYISDNFN